MRSSPATVRAIGYRPTATVVAVKLAVLGAAAIVAGLAIPIDGLVYIGAIWVVGGAIMRTILGPPRKLEKLDASATWGDAFAGRRGAGVVVSMLIGAATLVVGIAGVGFESDDAVWRWTAVAVGGIILGVQVLAMAMFSAGSGLQALVGEVGDPTHPATIRLDTLTETGMHVNERPRLELGLTVRPQGRSPYAVTVKKVVALTDLGMLRKGTSYRGLVDLERPDGVSVDWHDVVHDDIHDDVQGDVAASDQPTDDELAERLVQLDELLRDGRISAAEHAQARRDILGSL